MLKRSYIILCPIFLAWLPAAAQLPSESELLTRWDSAFASAVEYYRDHWTWKPRYTDWTTSVIVDSELKTRDVLERGLATGADSLFISEIMNSGEIFTQSCLIYRCAGDSCEMWDYETLHSDSLYKYQVLPASRVGGWKMTDTTRHDDPNVWSGSGFHLMTRIVPDTIEVLLVNLYMIFDPASLDSE